MEHANWLFKSLIRKRTLELIHARRNATAAATASATTFNMRAPLKINSTVFTDIIIATHWSHSSKPVSLTTPSLREAALPFSLKRHRTAKLNGSARDGLSTISLQNVTSLTMATDSSRVSSIMQRWMSRANTCARSPIPMEHRNRRHMSTSSIQTRLAKVKSHQFSLPDHKPKLKSVPAIRSQCHSEFKENRNREVWWWNLHTHNKSRCFFFFHFSLCLFSITLSYWLFIHFIVQWFKGAREITNAGRTIKEVFNDYVRFSVKESKENDSGIYFLVARNKHGVDRAFCQVTVSFLKAGIIMKRLSHLDLHNKNINYSIRFIT